MEKIKKYLLVACFLLITQVLSAQISAIFTDVYGKTAISIETNNGGHIILDTHGKILDMIDMNGIEDYYSNFNDYEAGKIKSIDDVKFSYYSKFNDYESGKIKSIGDITFSYYSDFNDYETGKIKSVGDIHFTYYSKFNDYEAGKIKSIGAIRFSYYSNFNDYETGKIKLINDHQYTYYSDSYDHKLIGKLRSGCKEFTTDGIDVIFRNHLPICRHTGCHSFEQ